MADVEDIKRQRDRIVSELSGWDSSRPRSDSNFVFFGGLENPHAVWQGLLDAGVLIRDVGIPGHLRVTAGTETETTAFLEALERILTARRPAAARLHRVVTAARRRASPLPSSQRTPPHEQHRINRCRGRTARMERTTSESSVLVEINLDGTGVSTSAPRCRSTTTC